MCFMACLYTGTGNVLNARPSRQEALITLSLKDVPLEKALAEIEGAYAIAAERPPVLPLIREYIEA